MTDQADFKQLVRERMARTGERYTTARAHIIRAHPQAAPNATADATVGTALDLGGVHDQTAALHDLLAAEGIDAPHTSLPPTEALLLGLGGGIGAAVFTFQYRGELPHLYVETRCTPQFAYDLGFVQRSAAGMGITLRIATGTTSKAAARVLDSALDAGRPALCLVDAFKLPHHAGTGQGGSLPWTVVVHEQRGDTVVITDRGREPLELARATLDAARVSYTKGKGAVATVEATSPRPLAEGITAGIRYCIDELAGREVRKGFGGNFGLRALDKWISEVTRTGKDGWRSRFAPGKPLAAGLRQAFGWIETSGTGGGAFRRLYADFLREASIATNDARYLDVAARYDALAASWTSLVTALLPDGTPLGDIRLRLRQRAAAIRRGASVEELREHDETIDALVARCEPFPVDAEATYEMLATGLQAIVDAERAAASQLQQLVQ
ncbi:MAG: DUF4872 domain-containing protein [Gemmatimonadetes bacterium]|nr:DUF4872 domain-containing protein [Gemmatimonadota bacterium]